MDKMGVRIRPLLFISKSESKRPFPLQAEYLKPEAECSEGCRHRKGTGMLGWMFSQLAVFQYSRISWCLLTCTKLGPNRRFCVVTEHQGMQMLAAMASCSEVLRCKASIRTQQQWLGTARAQAALHCPEELQCEGPAEALLRVVNITRRLQAGPGCCHVLGEPAEGHAGWAAVPPGAAPPAGTRRAGLGVLGGTGERGWALPWAGSCWPCLHVPSWAGGLCGAPPRPAARCLLLPQPSLRCSPASLSEAALICPYRFKYPSPQAGPRAREKRLPEPRVVRRLRAVASLGFLTAELLISDIAAALFLHRRVESRRVSLSAPSLCYKCLMSCLRFSFACLSFLSCMSCSAFNLLNFRCINFSP